MIKLITRIFRQYHCKGNAYGKNMKINLTSLGFSVSNLPILNEKRTRRFVALLTESNYVKLQRAATVSGQSRNCILNRLIEQIEIPESEEINNQSTNNDQ